MSGLFMDVHGRRRHRSHNHQNTPPTSASETTATSTSESSSSKQHVNDHIARSHRNKSATVYHEDAACNANYNNFNKRTEKEDDKCDDNEQDDAFDNILSLKLRKPKHWKWELSTSKSCTNIALPRILLYNHKGHLLVDALGDKEAVYAQEDYEKAKGDKTQKRYHQSHKQQPEYRQRSSTTNLTHSIHKALANDLNGLHIQEATPSPERTSMKALGQHHSRKAIEFDTADLPDQGLSRRSSSLRGVRFNVENNADCTFYESHTPEFIPTPPSTTTPTTSSSSGPREKRKYRRSQSSGRSSANSGSILERFSFQKGRFSSPENAEETTVQHSPRYFLRSCNAGTLVVKEDSFLLHPKRRRRLLRHRSTESLQSMRKFALSSSSSTQNPSADKSPTPTPTHKGCYSKQEAIRRHLADGNYLSNKQLSTSEEDEAETMDQKPIMDNVSTRHLPKYPQRGNEATDLNCSTDVHESGKVR